MQVYVSVQLAETHRSITVALDIADNERLSIAIVDRLLQFPPDDNWIQMLGALLIFAKLYKPARRRKSYE